MCGSVTVGILQFNLDLPISTNRESIETMAWEVESKDHFMRYSFRRFLKQNLQQIFLCALLVLPGTTIAVTETITESMAEYTTCAVYHRMTVGAMRRSGNLDALADAELEKMNQFIDLAKHAGIEEYGEELRDEIFNDEWQAITADMTDLINRNYDNISRLRYLYRERCNRYL